MRDSTWHLAFLALLLGCVSWYLVSFEQQITSTAEVRLEFSNAPENLIARSRGPEGQRLLDRITVLVRGPRSLVRSLDATKLGYPVDVSGLRAGENVITFDPAKLQMAGGLRVTRIEPPRMTIVAEEVSTRTLPVHVRWKGELAADWLLKEIRVQPEQVRVTGPKSLVSKLERLETVELAVEGATPRAVATSAGLSLTEEVVTDPAQVQVAMIFGPKTTKTVLNMPVTPRTDGTEIAKLRPAKVKLTLNAPVNLAAAKGALERGVKVYVDVPQDLPAGEHMLAPELELPQDTTLVSVEPQEIWVVVSPPSGAAPQPAAADR